MGSVKLLRYYFDKIMQLIDEESEGVSCDLERKKEHLEA
jgi:hypothetical protein